MDTMPHTMLIDIRDYECDMQGIINNAVYQNYLEHARHTFIKAKGLDFAQITAAGIHLVVMRAELDYKAPLKSGMTAKIHTSCAPLSKFKIEFTQRITIEGDDKLSLSARFIIASINESGKPVVYQDREKLFSAP